MKHSVKIVLDTNVLLVSVSKRSKHNWIFKNLIEGVYRLYVTTDIVLEYLEIVSQKMNTAVSIRLLNVLENLDNVIFLQTYYNFQLLKDPDDNKFVDCAVASNADYIISHDKDFAILKTIPFPKVKVISSEEFKIILETKLRS